MSQIRSWNKKCLVQVCDEQWIHSERLAAIGKLARGMGHEFGNILLRILGKADLAMMEKDPAKIVEHLKAIISAAEKAGTIVRNLQSFSMGGPQLAEVPAAQPMDEAISLISHELAKASIKLTKNYRQVPPVIMDAGRIGQVFLNLLINAIHAIPNGGKIEVGIKDATGSAGTSGVLFWIADSGTGIAADVIARIFEYSFTTKGDKGSGLGLSISKDIVESHGGTISVETELGGGSVFSVWLPRQYARALRFRPVSGS